jgi:hypothetical protein
MAQRASLTKRHVADDIKSIAAELRAHGAVLVVGAGISHRAGYPLSGQLPPLLWHALDSAPGSRAALAASLHVRDQPAKLLIGEDPRAVSAAFEHLDADPEARRAFQRAFSARDEHQLRPSVVHESVARLYHEGIAEIIVNFNWDRQIERAYQRLYGRDLIVNREYFKPHGDAAYPDQPWTFPGKASSISPGLQSALADLVHERPRILLLVGYSESDSGIVSDLLGPLASRWIVARIQPGAQGDFAIDSSAEIALPALAEALCDESWSRAWEYVSFEQRHGLVAALNGSGLRGADARSCPRLPEVDVAAAQIRAMHSVRITGPSGAGKSLVAYQVADSLNKAGVEVVRLIHKQ